MELEATLILSDCPLFGPQAPATWCRPPLSSAVRNRPGANLSARRG